VPILRGVVAAWFMTAESRRPPIPAIELVRQLEEMVSLMLASPPDQEAWADAHEMPAEEIALQFYDAVETFTHRLRDEGLLGQEDGDKLTALNDYLQRDQTKLFVGSGVSDGPEWQEVHQLASDALGFLRRTLGQHT
jgi:hypothetical protein